MPDDEIIKALELCFTPKGANDTCRKCPYHKFGALCKVHRSRAALDLINRQKSEIEKLQSDHSSMQSTLAKMSLGVEQAKQEAVKEFAERLKEKTAHWNRWDIVANEVDNLVKEWEKGGEE